MPRFARIKVQDDHALYHVMSRSVLPGYVLGDTEKEEMLRLIKHLSSIYFTETYGFCIMGNHFHLVVQMNPEKGYSDEEIKKRYQKYYGKEKKITKGQIPFYRNKWSDLSQYIKEIKQSFSRYYNKKHNRRGFFWSERFKSVLVENGDTLINLLAYIDLNPVRAGITDRPEKYRWSTMGYHVQFNNKDRFLSMDFGLRMLKDTSNKERLRYYRKYVYEKGSLNIERGKKMKSSIYDKEERKGFKITPTDRFLYRTRYFTDSTIIGSKEFVSNHYIQFKDYFLTKNDKPPKLISGLQGIYSLKKLSEG